MVLSFLLCHIVMTRDAIVSGNVMRVNVHHLHRINLPTRCQDRQAVITHDKEERAVNPPKRVETLLISPAHLRTITTIASGNFALSGTP